ncbi:hypothetical protein OESDEN_11064 [Oesophagostomum dentatum]|uniref:Uncharacterized protein n=1 Tax=Oesophagostomum dentatum TaxID=61180 RepID=A0A0B1T126_OESDE|nr:hypothetical protein OESDEN_11064 [Oesophagostomum dentatum]
MNTAYFVFAFVLTISRCIVGFPYPYYGGFAGVPVVAPTLGHPLAFSNGPIYTSITPSVHPLYHTPRVELRNLIRSADKDTVHFADTTHRSSAFPFYF